MKPRDSDDLDLRASKIPLRGRSKAYIGSERLKPGAKATRDMTTMTIENTEESYDLSYVQQPNQVERDNLFKNSR